MRRAKRALDFSVILLFLLVIFLFLVAAVLWLRNVVDVFSILFNCWGKEHGGLAVRVQ